MSETLIPTTQFRWLTPSFAALSIQPNAKRLQQLHHTPGGAECWIDVPIVEETAEEERERRSRAYANAS
jgi:hypothetical protein